MSNLILAPEQTAIAWQLEQLPNEPIKLQQGFYDFGECLFEAPMLIAEYGRWDVFFEDTLRVQHSVEQVSYWCNLEPRTSLYVSRNRRAF